MNNRDFLKETTEYIQSVYTHFESYQKVTWEILDELNRISKKRGVRYWLCYGTLLGAVRDRGQVPWDYDVDVVSFFNERQKLIDALETELSEGFYYTYINNSDYYLGGHRLLRVCKRGYSMMAIHVDVFFLVGASANERSMSIYHKRMERIKHIYEVKCLPRLCRMELNQSQKLLHLFYKGLYSIIPFKLLNRIDFVYLKKYSYNKFVYIPFYGVVVPSECFGTESVVIDNVEYPIPSGYDYILKKIYKDYYRYPSIDSRIREFYTHTKMIDSIQSNYKE